MTTALATLTNKLASRLNLGDGVELMDTLKQTAFKGQVSDAQLTALLIVANQYSLNPWTKEIFAFPDKNNGIVPVVGVDGWARIINSDANFDGIEFEQNDESCTCIIYRKDRTHPVKVTEWMDECKRPNTGPWQSHPKRMLRHKAMIQCARLAFGFAGIYDQDEAERFAQPPVDVTPQTTELPPYPDEKFTRNFPEWEKAIAAGKMTAAQAIAKIESINTLTDTQKLKIRSCETTIIEADENADA